MTYRLTSLLILLNFAACKIVLKPRPIRQFHGILGNCNQFENCVETGADFDTLFDLHRQAKVGCEKLKTEIFDANGTIVEEFKYGFHVVGHSQGGILARLVYMLCEEIRPLIRTLSTYGTPNGGMRRLGPTIDWMGNKTWDDLAAESVREYEKRTGLKVEDPTYTLTKLFNYDGKKSSVIEELENPAWGGYGGLDYFMAVYFAKDTIIIPRESQIFDLKFDDSQEKFESFDESPRFEVSDLGTLWDSRRLWFCRARKDHLGWIGDEQFEAEIFASDPSIYTVVDTEEEAVTAYRRNLQARVENFRFRNLACHTSRLKKTVFVATAGRA